MSQNLLLGVSRFLLPIPRFIWQRQIDRNARDMEASLSFMSNEHHMIRDFVVTEIARGGKPLSPALIADVLSLPLAQVISILDDLEKHMTFLFRNEQGDVVWAYPVTAEKTPHSVTLNSGETCYAA
ncbi:MAG: hypothetical protein KJ065_27160 [Anaerolineae bacterium]|nr:hypothetical protein [Anaerolineae bacterium]